MPDPIHQFEIKRLIPIDLFGYDASFTNSALFMVVAASLIVALLIFAMRGRALVPTRLQSVAETAYEFVANMVRESMGEAGMKFFPLIFTLFTFIFTLNMLGMIPGGFTVTSHIAVTAALAMLVFVTVLIVGFAKNGLHFLKLFVPTGVPIYVLPLVTLIEVISFLSRPVSHAVRLFANMLAGHITLKVFAGFIIMLLGAGAYAAIAPLPLLGAVALTALEFLVAFLQAYVFTMLTCMYLNDALHPGH
jgi:F-type H+-transporting ATPase subunit a